MVKDQTITASNVTMTVGETGKKIDAKTDGDGALSYAVKSGADVVKVDASTGALTGLKAGTATVTVTAAKTEAYNAATKDVTVTVNAAAPVPVTGVTLDKTALSITEGGAVKLNATVAPETASNKAVTWASSDSAIAKVVDGTVTGVKAGTATITVTTVDGAKTATATVTVTADSGGGSHKSGGSTAATQSNAAVYSIEAASGIENGTLTFSAASSVSGKDITVTAKPNGGYETASVSVADKDGKAVTVKDNQDGTYTFTMPASNVKVSAVFNQAAVTPTDTHDCPAKNFTDVNTALWYHEGIDYAIENGLMNGISADKFDPTGATTRAMLVTILYRVEGTPAVDTVAGFNDVENGTWYTDAVNWAADKGIVTGYSADTFGPTDNVTREQLATILYRYVQFKGVDVSVGETTSITSFGDFNTVSDWAVSAIRWANGAGIINGTDARKLAPQATASRAEIATMLMRAADMMK